SAQMQPLPPFFTPPMTMSLTPSSCRAYFSGMSSTLGFSLKKPPILPGWDSVRSATSSFIWLRGTMLSGSGTPRARARLASGSASTASTFLPWSLKYLISRAARVVLPTPPLPLMAIFMYNLPWLFISLDYRYFTIETRIFVFRFRFFVLGFPFFAFFVWAPGPLVSGKVFAIVEICLNLGMANSYHFMEFTSFFPLPSWGERAGWGRYGWPTKP